MMTRKRLYFISVSSCVSSTKKYYLNRIKLYLTQINILKLIQIILEQLLILDGNKLFPNFDQLFCIKHA